MNYPDAKNPKLVGTYPALVCSGGGFVWDEVLEYRVWCNSALNIPNVEDGDDYYYVFVKYEDALAFSKITKNAETPIALVLQKEYISEAKPGDFMHVKEERITEWNPEFLSRPRRTINTIPDFFAPNAPANRLDIIRGII